MKKDFNYQDYIQLEKEFKAKEKSMEERLWVDSNVGKFDDILRSNYNKSVEEFSSVVLDYIAELTNAYQGIFYTVNEEQQKVEAVAGYACNVEKLEQREFESGEGLVGQTLISKKNIIFKDLPPSSEQKGNTEIQLNPKEILVLPLLFNESVYGVIKLVFIKSLEEKYKLLLDRACQSIGAMLESILNNTKMELLLQNSQNQTEELKAQEEELRQNMEEMQATQEELGRKNLEIAQSAAESKGILKGINATMAVIEFDSNGIIKNANENFLKTVQYSLEEIKEKHHKLFVPEDILHSDDYQTFWERLASNQSISGIFKRKNSKGEIIWLNAIYSPILNAEGKVEKVMKLANDVTFQQELIAESKGILSGINTTMATIVFSPDGIIQEANDNFLKTIGYSLNEIQGKHHKIFVSKGTQETNDYKTFWSRLASGTPLSGVFQRIDSGGETILLNAIYNPILNAEGKVIKVMKFATDVTNQQGLKVERKIAS
ncbi:PAS domain S-box protein [Flexithrix dorotheae]|uniref:PAS domain S-box protein n=1 Tax=Flexithrix dorotheae TaxID=70993 RepID=UPI00037A0B26|nr:PAS domain S-box protein [Flexithrix dorotheae]